MLEWPLKVIDSIWSVFVIVVKTFWKSLYFPWCLFSQPFRLLLVILELINFCHIYSASSDSHMPFPSGLVSMVGCRSNQAKPNWSYVWPPGLPLLVNMSILCLHGERILHNDDGNASTLIFALTSRFPSFMTTTLWNSLQACSFPSLINLQLFKRNTNRVDFPFSENLWWPWPPPEQASTLAIIRNQYDLVAYTLLSPIVLGASVVGVQLQEYDSCREGCTIGRLILIFNLVNWNSMK